MSLQLMADHLKKLEQASVELGSAILAGGSFCPYRVKFPFPYSASKVTGKIDLLTDAADVDLYRAQSHDVHSNEALNECAQVMTLLHYVENQDRKRTIRMPGVVVANKNVIDLANNFNVLKDQFQELKNKLPKEDSRSKLKNAVQCCFLHAYRKIPVFTKPLKDVSFTWAANNSSVEKITVSDLRNRVSKFYLGDVVGSHPSDELGHSGQTMLDILSTLHENEILAIKRPVKPHVKLNYRYEEGGWLSADGSVPILIQQDCYSSDMNIVHLPDSVEQSVKRRARTSVYEDEPLLESLNCFRYKEPNYAS